MKSTIYSRRNFLKKSVNLALLNLLGPQVVFAAKELSSIDHFFFLIYISGGLDCTLGLDPLMHSQFGTDQKDVFLEYRPEDILRVGNIPLGPAATALKSHVPDIAIINGIVMQESQAHESQKLYINTGDGSGANADYSIEFAENSKKTTLGHLFSGSNYSGRFNPLRTALSSISKQSSDKILKEVFRDKSTSDAAINNAMRSYFNFSQKAEKFYKKKGELTKVYGDINEQYISAAVSFLLNLSSSASVTIGDDSIDSHSSHEGRHLASQSNAWEQVKSIFDLFKSIKYKQSSLFDHTTFMVTTEFSRTPFLNAAKGKDHNPLTNSVLLAGKNIPGNQVFGESQVIPRSQNEQGRGIHIGRAFDYKTGQTITGMPSNLEGIDLIFPENVAATMRKVFNRPKILSWSKSKESIF